MSRKVFTRRMYMIITAVVLCMTASCIAHAEEIDPDNIDTGLPVVYLTIDESKGTIDAMNSDEHHKTECEGRLSIKVPEDFRYSDMQGACESVSDLKMTMRGRGNTTWSAKKKPYKIKLKNETDIFGLGSNKHWVLIANAFDETLVKDRMTAWLGDRLGFEFTPRGYPVDLVMRNTEGTFNKYLGSYYLSENVRVDTNRLEIDKLTEDDTEMPYISGGYLIQGGSQTDESSPDYFKTRVAGAWATDTPSFDTEDGGYDNDAQKEYIQGYMQKMEDVLFSDDSTKYRDLMDLDSSAKYFLIDQMSKNGDGYGTGSTYIYKKRDTDVPGKMYWGPLWDFDFAWSTYDTVQGFEIRHDWVKAMMYDTSENGFVKKIHEVWPELKEALSELTKKDGVLDGYYEETWKSQKLDSIANPKEEEEGEEGERSDEFGEEAQLTFSDDYRGYIDRLKSWIDRRAAYIEEQLKDIDSLVHKVRYISDGEVYMVQYYEDSQSLTYIPSPEKEGMLFLGWTDEKGDLLVPGNIELSVDKDMTLTAKFIPEDEATKGQDIALRRKSDVVRLEGEEGYYQLQYTVIPEDAQDRRVEWTVDDESKAEMTEGGMIIVKDYGDVVFTGTLKSGKTKTFTLHVVHPDEMSAPSRIWPDTGSYQLDKGGQAELSISTDPEKSVIDMYDYESSDEKVAAVNDGVITAKGPGTAKIKVITTTFVDNIETGESETIERVTYVTVNVSGKIANTLKAKGKTIKEKASVLRKKSVRVSRKKAIKISGKVSRLTYSLSAVKKTKFRKYFRINKKTGKITIKKGLKKGTYRLRVRIRAAGNSRYFSKTANTTVTVKVR